MRGYRKYNAAKLTVDGEKFDSRLEFHRWCFLQEEQKDGRISGLRRQVPFEVVPKSVTMEMVPLKTKVKYVERVVEKAVHYVADFVYVKDGMEVVEDTKGVKTPDYVIKRKLMRQQGHPIREITRATEEI